MSLTKKQKALLDFLRSFHSEYGYSPSFQKIADALGYTSKSTVHFHIENLKQKAYLDENFSAKIIQSGNQLPLLGQIAAGTPLEHFSHDEYIEVPSNFLQGDQQHYVLQVKGHSMIEDAIIDGDYVVIRDQNTARNGQIVVASINGESTLKRFYKKKNVVELRPANKNYDSIVFKSPTKFKVKGVLAGVLRPIKGG